ncbi:MAG: PAS domain S-box protein, partial [Spirochaetales bacterium]|nr:PAS domain S-box protein [Spirochaetales bacterium]
AMAHMLDVAPNSITVHTTEGRFLYANKKTYDLHGWTEEEFSKINLHELDVPESAAQVEERVRLIFQEGSAVFQVEHFRKDGTTFPLEVSAKIVEWQGRPAVLSIATDITERKKAEQSLKKSDERIQALLAANPDIMFIFDRQGKIVDYHASDEKELFAEGKAFLNRHVSEVLPDYLAELTMEKLKELFSANCLLTYTYKAEHEGRVRRYESRLVPCGKDCALAIVRNITELR